MSTDSNGHQRATLGFAKNISISVLSRLVYSKRKKSYWDINPEPTLYGAEIPTSVLHTPETARKPAKRNVHKDEVSDFSTFEKHERRVTFYKMGRSLLDIPEVSETIITVDEFMHVKLLTSRHQ